MTGRTLYDKIFDAHLVSEVEGEAVLYIDLHLIHEVTTPQAFAGLRAAGRPVRRPERQRLQHEQIERALQQLSLHGGRSTFWHRSTR